MKRENITLSQIADLDNLRLAYCKAKKGLKKKESQLIFEDHLDENLELLSQQLTQGSWRPGAYHIFEINDPKKRTIAAPPFYDRVVHHAVINLAHHNFEKFLIEDTYATRKHKGTYKALEKACQNQKKFEWYLKLDVRHYFESIHHEVLTSMLNRRFKNQGILHMFSALIDSYHSLPDRGIPIGTVVSQYFANHYLGHADHFIKSTLRIRGYVRYMDDMVLWGNDKNVLWKNYKRLKAYIQDYLQLELKPEVFNKTTKRLPFLGYLLDDTGSIYLAMRSRKRAISKMKMYNSNLLSNRWNQQEYQGHIVPLLAFVQHANSWGFRQKALGCV